MSGNTALEHKACHLFQQPISLYWHHLWLRSTAWSSHEEYVLYGITAVGWKYPVTVNTELPGAEPLKCNFSCNSFLEACEVLPNAERRSSSVTCDPGGIFQLSLVGLCSVHPQRFVCLPCLIITSPILLWHWTCSDRCGHSFQTHLRAGWIYIKSLEVSSIQSC